MYESSTQETLTTEKHIQRDKYRERGREEGRDREGEWICVGGVCGGGLGCGCGCIYPKYHFSY